MMNALLLQVERLETRVVAPLKAYGDIVKNKRVSLETEPKQMIFSGSSHFSDCLSFEFFVICHSCRLILGSLTDNSILFWKLCCLLCYGDKVTHIYYIKKEWLAFVLCAVWTDSVSTVQADLKKFNTDLKRELKELQKLEKIRLRNPADRQSIVSFTYGHLTLVSTTHSWEVCFLDLLNLDEQRVGQSLPTKNTHVGLQEPQNCF